MWVWKSQSMLATGTSSGIIPRCNSRRSGNKKQQLVRFPGCATICNVAYDRDPAVRLGSFGFKKVKKNLKAVRVVSVPLRFGSSRFKKRFGSMSAIRVLPESNSNLAISFQSILCWNYFWGKGRVLSLWKQSRTKSFWLWHYFSGQVWLCLCSGGCLAGYLAWLAVDVSFWVMPIWAILSRNICFWKYFLGQGRVQSLWE